VALLALGTDVTIVGERGSETVDLETFLKERGAKRRIVSRISFAIPTANTFRFAKVTRKHPHGASVLSIAALLPVAGGIVKGAHIAYGAMAPTPIRAGAVEKALEGRPLDDAAIEAAAAVAGKGTSPQSDPHASDWYRANVLPVHLKRLLKR
jgi:CO/xanthine dehydrogenase FAD-binding subunit